MSPLSPTNGALASRKLSVAPLPSLLDSGPLAILDLPLTSLDTAADSSLSEVCAGGKTTIIDFWTTKCTNCPAALDKLDSLQVSSSHQNVQIISICCDSCDGAREIIERGAEPRWANLRHYFTPLEWKEKAKAYFGFAQVPFYVVVNPDGATVHSKGNASKVDLAAVPGAVRPPALIEDPAADKENEVEVAPIVEKLAISEPEAPRAFIMDEDF
ncbi:hypothetical protein TeGR_g6491 [Tetraparma gracilis]|uniref:Thioredoxin domain-containing protein n=1 Tax=Tetraparma gracilis TaxID=2962635 RepID=A0ABQ6ND05_9STRA|nr:hypothetical protein TeGR_g6491 [Tetraparma gracilis]